MSGISWAERDPVEHGGQDDAAAGFWPTLEAREAEPALGDILRHARKHQQLTLRQVEQRIGLPNAHLSQIERGSIRRPDPAILMDLAELYDLNYRLIAEWAGYLDAGAARTSGHLTGLALRMFVELDPVAQREVLEHIERLRNQSAH
ncbi:MAG TPA: helix-turn-helix transcriptional regulator [Streptosporangiaceae bacterium]|nr:helix-turn-helix transcriptional regulator [Streptosporangiaceae bacterium]